MACSISLVSSVSCVWTIVHISRSSRIYLYRGTIQLRLDFYQYYCHWQVVSQCIASFLEYQFFPLLLVIICTEQQFSNSRGREIETAAFYPIKFMDLPAYNKSSRALPSHPIPSHQPQASKQEQRSRDYIAYIECYCSESAQSTNLWPWEEVHRRIYFFSSVAVFLSPLSTDDPPPPLWTDVNNIAYANNLDNKISSRSVFPASFEDSLCCGG